MADQFLDPTERARLERQRGAGDEKSTFRFDLSATPDDYIPVGGWGLRIPRFNDDGTPMVGANGRRITQPLDDLPYGVLVGYGVLPDGIPINAIDNWVERARRNLLDNYDQIAGTGGGGGGRGGGGAAAPVYQAPDRRLVEDSVKAQLAALAGTVDPGRLRDLTNLYMSEDKRAFAERETQQLDPMASVQAKIREGADYKAIHKLRPESVDEFEWISSRQGALQRAGVTPATAERLGVVGAQVGASQQDVVQAGSVAAFSQSGKELDELKERMSGAMSGVLGVI